MQICDRAQSGIRSREKFRSVTRSTFLMSAIQEVVSNGGSGHHERTSVMVQTEGLDRKLLGFRFSSGKTLVINLGPA